MQHLFITKAVRQIWTESANSTSERIARTTDFQGRIPVNTRAAAGRLGTTVARHHSHTRPFKIAGRSSVARAMRRPVWSRRVIAHVNTSFACPVLCD